MDELVVRGKVVAAHGVRGALEVAPQTDFPERFEATDTMRLRLADGEVRNYRLTRVRHHKGRWLIEVEGVADRGAAEALRGAEVVVSRAELPPLPEGEYYYHQILGLEVKTTDGESVGVVEEILTTGSNDVYVTRRALIPAIRDVIERVDPAAGEIVIRPLPGLLD